MRLEGWHSKEIFKAIEDRALDNANGVVDGIVAKAKANAIRDIKHDPPIFREGKFAAADVSFTPKTGHNKNKLVQFHTESRWTGRYPGQLVDTIRRVNSYNDPYKSVRAYAGNFKVYYALMVEKTGYTDKTGRFHAPIHFLQSPFHEAKSKILDKIKNGG